ncbi:hypothetical protein [Clostridium ganghwense]|uniref:Uncharacterized protein n=1 Tax=Clostridium ganghwense TaxID=312089 RepID=A0ABT4CW18_9CLOT|nr:hypothetical protein [Clostridium ganghwense]MCY6372401.1 hypothetical protein [Clostridium ganghwense]
MYRLPYSNQSEAANSFKKFMSDKNKRYTARPLDRYHPATTRWLLIPSTSCPAYNYGKYSFLIEDKTMLIGLYVEKGLGPKACGLYDPNQIINRNWIWYQFYEDMKSGKIDEIISEIIKNNQQSIYFSVDGYIDDIAKLEYHYVVYEDRIETIKSSNKLDNLNQITRISQIPESLSTLEYLDWMWLNFYIEVPFIKNDVDNNNLNTISEYDLYKNVLEPLEKWVK